MKKILFTIVMACICLFTSNLEAQVTIGNNSEPNAGAVLDLQSGTNKGMLMPRVALTSTRVFAPVKSTDGSLYADRTHHTEGMTVYNTATNNTDPNYEVSPGYYYNDGTKWVRMPQRSTNWFYMPSISFDTSTNGTFTKELYSLYYNQFNTPSVISTGAPASVPFIPAATDMYYYITSFDATVFGGSDSSGSIINFPHGKPTINANGSMTYTVNSNATACSYINIAFVLK